MRVSLPSAIHLADDIRLGARLPLYHGFRALGWPAPLPLAMSFVVTDRCNSLCATCHIGKRYLDDPRIADGELSLDEHRALYRSIGRPAWITLSGGEPFMRKDFPEIAAALIETVRPRVVNVPTNATFVHATFEGTKRILRAPGSTRLVLNLSIDAIGKEHDRLRGFEGNFERMQLLYEKLRTLRDPRLVIGVNTVISSFNAGTARRTIDYVLDELRPDSFVVEVAQHRPEYHNDEVALRPDPALVHDLLEHVRRRLGSSDRRGVARLIRAFRMHLLREADAPRPHRCFAGFATCAILPHGEVWSSTSRADVLGNVRDFELDFGALWRSAGARRARAAIRHDSCTCESSNVAYTNALLSPRALAKVAAYAAGWS